jgi:hypothetical protein
MKFRPRDAAAALLSIVLAKVAWTDTAGPEALSVSAVLAFYYEAATTATVVERRPVPRQGQGQADDDDDDAHDDFYPDDDTYVDDDVAIQRRKVQQQQKKKQQLGEKATTPPGVVQRQVRTAPPVPLDVDGDGTVEALVVPGVVRNGTVPATAGGEPAAAPVWGLRVLDLKPLHGRRGAAAELTAFPFYPAVMFTSDGVGVATEEDAAGGTNTEKSPPVPIKMASGQILFRNGIQPTQEGEGSTSTAASPAASNGKHKPAGKFVESDDKTRHYFCGTGWGDAAERCATPCPDGTSSGCPEGESCYADTPCDSQLAGGSANADDDLIDDDVTKALGGGAEKKPATRLILTPRNGLPSVATLWSDGSVTMHSLTGDYVPGEKRHGRGKRDKQRDITKKSGASEDTLLELRPMWRTNPFRPTKGKTEGTPGGGGGGEEDGDQEEPKPEQPLPLDILEFDEIDLTIDTTAPVGEHGAVIVAARYTRKNHEGRLRAATSYHAIDAFTGNMIWSHGDKEGRGKLGSMTFMGDLSALADEDDANSGNYGVTSSARRRSFLPGAASAANALMGPMGVDDDVTTSEDCMDSFRRWVLDPDAGVLPHVSWASGRDDARIHVAHFDRKHQGQGWERNSAASTGKKGGSGGHGSKKSPPAGKKMGWQKSMLSVSRRAKAGANVDKNGSIELESVRPNVVLFRNREGVSVLSLRNGRPVCHLSLLDNSLYADINMDGVIEQVQVITTPSGPRSSAVKPNVGAKAGQDASQTFVSDLINRAIKSQARGNGGPGGGGPVWSPLCHVLVLSGIPARKEVFNANLCSNKKSSVTPAKNAFSAAPPLAVPGLSHHGMDLVFALNSRQVSRYDSSGNEVWTTLADHTPLPSWGAMGTHSPASMQQIDFKAVTRGAASPAVRPILVSGEDGASILSAGRGVILASLSFPQSSVSRPILADLSGDGTSDVLVISTDAVWGYKISVRASSASFLRIISGLLFMAMALAALYNRFSQPPGTDRRSTDA